MSELSLCMPYYRNPGILKRHIEIFRNEWSADLRRRIEVVVVDDGSPDERASDVVASMWRGAGIAYATQQPRISVYRVTEDRPWHQHGARNLGAHVAKAPWLLMTDIDHVVPPATLDEVLRRLPSMRSHEVLTFGRVDAPMGTAWRAGDWRGMEPTRRDDGTLKAHVNSFVVSRKHYWRTGGYDESFCGLYGTDIEFRRRLFTGRTITHHLADCPLIRVGREVIPDASTRDVERKTAGRNELKRAIAARKIAEGRAEPLTLDFEWERAA
jgi:hypothetical protein